MVAMARRMPEFTGDYRSATIRVKNNILEELVGFKNEMHGEAYIRPVSKGKMNSHYHEICPFRLNGKVE